MSIILVIALVAGCFAALPWTANAAPTPVPGNPSWDIKYKTAQVIQPSSGPAADIPNNPRNNASGDKISSNAHSADFPGLYFYWDDKQKDNGVLLVNPDVFDLFTDGQFILTAKNSNNYWGYTISKATGTLIDGVYAYGISKQIKYNEIGNNGKISAKTDDLKNINMVFIDGKYKPATLTIEKVWLDEEGLEIAKPDNREATFNKPYTLGENTIEITDFSSAVNGKKVTITENTIPGYKTLQNPKTVTIKADEKITVEFTNQKQYAKITIEKNWDLLPDSATPCAIFNIYDLAGNPVHRNVCPGTYLVKEGTYTIKEKPISGFTLTSPNNIEVTVAADETKKVSFTNKEDQATINLNKVWVDPDATTISKPANVEFSWTDFASGWADDVSDVTVKAGTRIVIGEDFKGSWTDDDGELQYTVTCSSITVNGDVVTEVDFVVAKDQTYDIVFTNQVTVTKIEKEATVIVTKIWVDKNGDAISAPDGIDAKLTKPWRFGEHTVAAGTKISFNEKPITPDSKEMMTPVTRSLGLWSAWEPTGKTRIKDGIEYTEIVRTRTITESQEKITTTTSYELVGVTINDKPSDDNVCFTAEGGKEYKIVFTNKVVIDLKVEPIITEDIEREFDELSRELPPKDIGGPIPSESHVGKWWADGHGVIALAGSSITGHLPGQYAVGISKSGFDKFGGTVYVGYGSGIDKLDTIIAFNSDGTWKVIRGQAMEMIATIKSPDASMYVESNPYSIKEVLEFEWLFIFNNVNGNGAMHAYLLEF